MMSVQNQQETIQGQRVTENIFLCPDGIYRWYYSFPMLRNPSILFTVWKVLGFSFGVVYLIVMIGELVENVPVFGTDGLKMITVVFLILILFFFMIGFIAYLIVAAIYGGYYQVLFEMNANEVVHIQVSRQFKKTEAIAWLAMFTGAVTGNVGRVGQGLLVAAKTTSTSELSRVSRLKIRKKRNTIYVNQSLSKNQIYAEAADFDFVAQFLQMHCPNAVLR